MYRILTFLLVVLSASAFAQMPMPEAKPADTITHENSAHTHSVLPALKPIAETDYTPTDIVLFPNPKPLGNSMHLDAHNAKLYADIFRLQEDGLWKQADRQIAKLTDFRLRGHVLYQRYMHGNKWRASYAELKGWLDLYSDHPNANRIHALAVQRHRPGEPLPKKYRSRKLIHGTLSELQSYTYLPRPRRAQSTLDAIYTLENRIERDIRRDRPTNALKKLETSEAAPHMSAAEYDTQRAKIAASYLFYGKIEEARHLAEQAVERSGADVPLAGWVAGLTAWRQKDYSNAYTFFSISAESSRASTWTKSAASYWASRAAMKTGQFRDVSHWLETAAQNSRTFYGLLATQALGQKLNFNWAVPALNQEKLNLLMRYPEARRAVLLIDAGQRHLASAELLRLSPEGNSYLKDALIAFAVENDLPSFAIRFGHAFDNQGKFYDAALYPTGSWKAGEYLSKDMALIHAIARQESTFNYAASNDVSRATGLMQILPSTANWLMNTDRFSGSGYHALKDPSTNIAIGQKYLERLARLPEVEGDLFSLLIAYNAGPGNLRKWKKKLSDIDDPLLFVEMLPYAETRAYVERVMSNYWIYQMRMGKDTPTLRAAASGQPAYL